MTSTVIVGRPAQARSQPTADVVVQLVEQAAREITGVDREVRARARVADGAAVLELRLPIRYPMPVWQVAGACRAHVTQRVHDRIGLPVRRFDIEVAALPGRPG
jgi:hypothetical protein